jgi:hypothetical protein
MSYAFAIAVLTIADAVVLAVDVTLALRFLS